MASTRILLTSMGLVVAAGAAAARADTIDLTPKGYDALKNVTTDKGIPVVMQRTPTNPGDPPRYYMRGRIGYDSKGARRDAADRPTTQNPAKFFFFKAFIPETAKPWTWSEMAFTGQSGAQGDNPLDWSFVSGVHHDIDGLDDLRGLFSNRDLMYQPTAGAINPVTKQPYLLHPTSHQPYPVEVWSTALSALLFDLGVPGTVGNKPVRTDNNAIQFRDGCLPRFFARGPLTAQESHKGWTDPNGVAQPGLVQKRAISKAEPSSVDGYSPVDPAFWDMTPESAITNLLEAIARFELVGEPPNDAGVTDACFACAHFLCETLPTLPESGTPADRVQRCRTFGLRCRATLLSFIEAAAPAAIAFRRSKPGSDPDKLRYSSKDDLVNYGIEVSVPDMAKAALDVLLGRWSADNKTQILDGLVTPAPQTGYDTPKDQLRIVDMLVSVATGDPFGIALDSRAYNALTYLVQASPMATDNDAGFLAALVRRIGTENDPKRAQLLQDALARAGIGSPQVLVDQARSLVDIAIAPTRDKNNNVIPSASFARDNAVEALRNLFHSQHMDQNARSALTGELAKRRDALASRNKSGTGSPEEKDLLGTLNGMIGSQ
jgi:hypothetical protein